jgi:IclR family transcriptional regulator, acetate operon repressor
MITHFELATSSDAAQPVDSIRSVERAIRLLRELEVARRPMRLSDLSAAAEMPKATVQRLLAVLERNGFVEKQQGRYEVGVAAVPLAYSFLMGNSLTQASVPVLQELAKATDETATLFVRHGFERVVVQRVEGANPLRYTMPVAVGQRITLLIGAAGHVLASALPERDLAELLAGFESISLVTGEVLTRPQLLTRLEEVRRQGFSVTRGERTPGVVSVAAPVVTTERGTIAALSVTGTSDRVTADKAERLIDEVRLAARAIAERYSHI